MQMIWRIKFENNPELQTHRTTPINAIEHRNL